MLEVAIPIESVTGPLREALDFNDAKAGYRDGCDPAGYRADAAQIKDLLVQVEAIVADSSQPVDNRLLACSAVSGLAGMIARNEQSATYGKKSYFAMWTAGGRRSGNPVHCLGP